MNTVLSKRSEKLLNSKIYSLNTSLSKFVLVGLSVDDFSPLVRIGGRNGFSITLSEESWKEIFDYQGVITNYFYFPQVDQPPVIIENLKLQFEKINDIPVLKITKEDSNYVHLGQESVDNLWRVKEIIESMCW